MISEISQQIYLFRYRQVMLDSDLAVLFYAEIKILNQAVQRNLDRFPEDFRFQLKDFEYESLRSQFVTLKKGRGNHRKYLPYVFSEHGVAQLKNN